MGWFSRKPKPYDGLVDSLVNRPWEWGYVEADEDPDLDGFRHASGVFVTDQGVVLGVLGYGGEWEAAQRAALKTALLAHASARVNCGKLFDFDSTAKLLAEAVLKGDKTAAVALADRVKELV